jgi:hypothetical protein
MSKRPRFSGSSEKGVEPQTLGDVSHRAHTIARLIDRLCRVPGVYTIRLVIPSHSRAPWEVQMDRVERIRMMDIERR